MYIASASLLHSTALPALQSQYDLKAVLVTAAQDGFC